MLKFYYCTYCGTKEERYVRNNDTQLCYKCGNTMEQKITFNGTGVMDKPRIK